MGHLGLDLKLTLTAKMSDLNVFYFAFSLLFGESGVHFADFIAFYASFRRRVRNLFNQYRFISVL